MLNNQDIVLIRHAEAGKDGITEAGRVAAIEKGQVFAKSVFGEISHNGIALFDGTALRVQKTMEAIKVGMRLPSDYPVHTLPLDGKYDEVSKHEIWQSGKIIRGVSAEIGKILIVTNGQYIQKLADNLGKYGGISYQESDRIKSRDNHLSYLEYSHWNQNLTGDIPQDALEVMGEDFGKSFSLNDIAKELGKKLRFGDLDLEDYTRERVGYFDIHYVNERYFQEITGTISISKMIITFNPRIERKDNEVFVTMPTRDEYIAEFIRASSYLGNQNKPFINPIQWLKCRIDYHGDLFR